MNDYEAWLVKNYSHRHHRDCEIIGYGTCTCYGWAREDYEREKMNPNLKWDRRFLRLAEHISQWSKDPSSKIGAVLVNDDRIVTGMGYNGFPRGVGDDDERYANREFKYAHVVHAEVNAILNAGAAARGCSLYVWPAFGFPNICSDCCKFAIQAGVSRLVGAIDPTIDEARAARWADSLARSASMLTEAGIPWTSVEMT